MDKEFNKEFNITSNNELNKNLDTNTTTTQNSISSNMTLEYGDIISINAPKNSDIHEHTFFITYIDSIQINLTNVSTLLLYELNISEEGNITDESIDSIELLSRSDTAGYAQQNGLLPKKWIDIHFNGDFPLILTGEITNLEEDMIEITTYPDLDVMYIDFEYKGLPKTIPIKSIQIRKKPEQLVKIGSLVSLKDTSQENPENPEKASMEMTDSGESIISIPENAETDRNIRDALHSLYIDANDIIFGNEEEEIEQVVEIKESEKRYTIDAQVNSLMDELLSTIPNSKRTTLVLDNIHRIITRFKELRNKFSQFDENHNIRSYKLISPDFKPLIDHITKMDVKLKWILPVIQSKKKLYSLNNAKFSHESNNDSILLTTDIDLKEQSIIQEEYYENKTQTDNVKYKEMLKRINSYMTPFENLPNEYNLDNNINVLANLESIVNNLENFESTVVNKSEMAKRRFVIQRYNMGTNAMEPEVLKTGKRIYIRKNICPNDTMSIKSLITLPSSVVKYSKTELPCTNIMERTSLAQNPPLLFRILKSKINIDQYIVEQFEKEIDYEKMADETKTNFLSTMKEYVLDETLADDDNKLEKFLKVIIPNSRSLIRLVKPYIQDKLSLVEIVKELEPFMVYVEDITYKQYMEIRFFIKERLIEVKKTFAQKNVDFSIIQTTKYNIIQKTHGIARIMYDMDKLLDIFISGYKMDFLKKSQNKQSDTGFHHQPSELLSSIMLSDNGKLMHNLIIQNNLQLFIPNQFIDALQPVKIGDMGRIEKIRANDCNRRFLAKRYSSLHDLQKDQHEEIWFDKEFDDTPYDILKKYKGEQTKMQPENFVEFLSENLIAKHDCPVNISVEMAKTIILGKKYVSDGEYAILEIRPTLPKEIDESSLSQKEKSSIDSESNNRKIIHYYRRLKNNWIIDKTVDEAAFIDNNTLFCNMDNMCFKNKSNSVCEPMIDASERIKAIAKRKLYLEADNRYTKSVNDMTEDIDYKINYYINTILKSKTLKEIQLYKPNNYAYELGKFAETSELIQSPYIGLRDFILSQDDFVKRQEDIHKLCFQFTRSPMVDELNEDPNWLYCKETNTKLIPNFFYILSCIYLNGDAYDYQYKEDEICRNQGELSDDGDSIVDKYSGYVIKKIEFSTDEGYDEAGFKLTTNEIMQKDLKTVIEESLKNHNKVFENETTQHVYNIFITLCENIGIPHDGIEELIMRLTVEIIETNIKSETSYEKYSEKIEKQKGKRPISYIQYRNQTIILMVSSVLLISLQTVTPSYKPKITAPGCVRSFSGFPLDGGDENMTGLKYIACVVNKTKSSTVPWNSLKGMPLQIIENGIKKILIDILIPRQDITDLYIKKREYLILNPEETIPEEHNMIKWSNCLPPMVQFSVKKTLQNVSAEFKADFIELMRNGNKDQRISLNVFKSKLLMYGYGLIEHINDVVAKKDLLLKTGANVAFLQNACCSDKTTNNIIAYFIDEIPEIEQYISIMASLTQVVNNTKDLTQAPVFFHNKNTAIIRPKMPIEHFDTNIYAAFIYYCRFDRNIPVPEELRQLCSERPAGYNSTWSLEEKIKFLRENGKRFTINQLHQLMDIIYNKNLIKSSTKNTYSKINAFKEFLEYLDENNSTIIDRRLIMHLLSVISEHNPTQYVVEDNQQTENLKNYLANANKRMYESIYEFLDKYGNISSTDLEHLDLFLLNITDWSIDLSVEHLENDSLHSIAQFIKNSVNAMTKVLPGMIINNINLTNVPTHWNLSSFHEFDILRFMQKYYEPINKFKKDKTIVLLLNEIQVKLIDLNILIQHIPIYSPIQKDSNTFYSLFDKQTVYALLKYLWYSVIYEYINMSDDNDLLHTDIEENKQARRTNIRKQSDIVESLQTIDEDDLEESAMDYMADVSEISIKIGDLQDFKRRTAQLLVAFLKIDLDNKNSIDLTYNKISEKMNRSKQTEKKMITDFFRDMESEERKVRFLEKTYKMGRWNVGMQKGLVQYEKSTYDRERGEIIERLNGTNLLNDDVAIMERDIYEIEQDDAAEIEEEYENEANDITGLGEEYEDDYYGDEGNGDEF